MFDRVRSHLTYANVVVTILAFVVLGGGTLALAAIPSSSGALTACSKKQGGAVRIIDERKKCKRGERRLTWNQKGQAGLPGPAGQPGASGKDGAKGDSGAAATKLF